MFHIWQIICADVSFGVIIRAFNNKDSIKRGTKMFNFSVICCPYNMWKCVSPNILHGQW